MAGGPIKELRSGSKQQNAPALSIKGNKLYIAQASPGTVSDTTCSPVPKPHKFIINATKVVYTHKGAAK